MTARPPPPGPPPAKPTTSDAQVVEMLCAVPVGPGELSTHRLVQVDQAHSLASQLPSQLAEQFPGAAITEGFSVLHVHLKEGRGIVSEWINIYIPSKKHNLNPTHGK